MEIKLSFDKSRCIGCLTCIIACKDWNNISAKLSWIRIDINEEGEYPNLHLNYIFNSCFHCANPPCVKACPSGAIIKREEDGIVLIDTQICIGGITCDFICKKVCPYDAPKFNVEELNPKMQKCNLCIERIMEKKRPICVDSCLMRALDVVV